MISNRKQTIDNALSVGGAAIVPRADHQLFNPL
jgi:hypothetical protein